jgi:hypothetical protein
MTQYRVVRGRALAQLSVGHRHAMAQREVGRQKDITPF